MNSGMCSLRWGCKTSFSVWVPSVSTYGNKFSTQSEINPKKIRADMIGPADPISNLRPVVFKVSENESDLEKKLRIQREEVQKWNQTFWLQHNHNFYKQKQDYMRKSPQGNDSDSSEKKALTSEEMSSFYKDFLDKNWEVHLKYNVEWYQKNFKLLLLSYRVIWNGITRKMLPRKARE